MSKKFDPEHAAAHGYTRADWNAVDAPKLTSEDLAKRQSFTKAFPALAKKMRKAGRPKAENPKVAVSIRLDKEVVDAFKESGPGWQSRMNAALREAAHR